MQLKLDFKTTPITGVRKYLLFYNTDLQCKKNWMMVQRPVNLWAEGDGLTFANETSKNIKIMKKEC